MNQPVILSAVRTPIGKFQGTLSSFAATELGAKVVAEAVRRAGIEPKLVDEVIWETWCPRGWGRIRRGRLDCAGDWIRALRR